MHKVIIVKKLLFILISMILVGTISVADDSPVSLPEPPASASEIRLADVIAQRDITQTSFNTVSNVRGMHLGAAHVHKYENGARALYAYDSGNSRILAFINPDWTTQSDLPDRVFGQNDSYVTGACNGDNNSNAITPTARTLCLHRGAHAVSQEEEPRFTAMDTDLNGNLFVIDQYNNRMLMFLDPFGSDPNEGDTTADRVWGQPDFNSKICNRGAGIRPIPSYNLTSDGLCTTNTQPASIDPMFATGLDIDVWGNLWVTDLINNRVLRFPYDQTSGFPSLLADIVLGQPNLTSIVNNQGSCVSKPAGVGFCQLFYLQVHDVTGEIFIIHDQMSPVISVYAPNTTEQNPTSYTYSRQIGKGKIRFPGFIHFLDGDRMLVEDEYQAWKAGFHIFTTSGTFVRTITDSNVVGTTPDGNVGWIDIKGKYTIVDNYMFVAEQRNHNSIMVFDMSQLDALNQLTYVGEILGGPNYVWNSITGLGIRSPYGMTVSKTHNQIFVADRYRILVWNLGAPLAGRSADFVIGQPNFTSNASTTSGAFVFRDRPEGMSVDEANNKLWVARNQEAYAFNLPITANMPLPVVTYVARIPNSVYTGNLAVKGQTGNFVFGANDMVFNPIDQTVWIIDTDNSRAARVINPYSPASRQVDLIIGQNNIDGRSCNRGVYNQPNARTLCFPGFGAIDNFGNLYIAEGVYEGRADMPGNKRIVEYDKATIEASVLAGPLSEPAATRVYSVTNFTTSPISGQGYSCPSNSPCNPIGIAFDSQNRMAVLSDAYFNTQNKRIYIYENPLKNAGYVAFNTTQDKILTYAMGQGGQPAFGHAYQSFYQDHTWNRVMVVNVNRAPDAPTYIEAADDAVDQELNLSLSWNAAVDPDADEVTYNVYFGQDEAQLTAVVSNQSARSYSPTLNYGTTYYWQIGATDGLKETKGPIWSFTTIPVNPGMLQSNTVMVVEETGLTNNYTLELLSQPAADVHVTLSFSQEGQITVDLPTLTFTSADWNIPQTVVVSAIDDSVVEGQHEVNILYAVTSEDEHYDALDMEAMLVTITDNDLPIIELLTNNSFDLDLITPFNQPDGWNLLNQSKDRLTCNTAANSTIAYEGNCAYFFQGRAGEKAILSQITRPMIILTPTNVLHTRVVYRTNSVKPSLMVRLFVYYHDGSVAKRAGAINTVAQEYVAFNLKPLKVKAGKTVKKLKLVFQNRATAGRVYIDSASVNTTQSVIPAGAILDLPSASPPSLKR